MSTYCVECGAPFARAHGDTWKTRCLPCWRRTKAAAAPVLAPVSRVENELCDHIRQLLMLCHPDRHGGSTLATTTTQWLLRVRKELRA